jgi:type IX secretion system PorP/SprF family membrane protein
VGVVTIFVVLIIDYMMKKVKIMFLIALGSLAARGYSQHSVDFNQHMVYQPLANFAAASSYSTTSAALFHRNQWAGLKGAPVSNAGIVALPLDQISSRVGLSFRTDNIGVNENVEISLGYAYSTKLNRKSSVSFSLSPTFKMKQSNFSKLTLTDDEDDLFADDLNYKFLDFKFGSYYFSNQFYVGFGAPNLLTVNTINENGAEKIEYGFVPSKMNYFLHGGARFKLDSKNNLLASSFIKSIGGASLHVEVNALWEYDQKIGFGLGYRSTNDLVAFVRFKPTKSLMISYAYQYGVVGQESMGGGSHEVLLVFEVFKRRVRYKYFTPRF